MSDYREESPINPLPPIVVAVAILVIGIEIFLAAGAKGYIGGPTAIGWRLDAVQKYAFSEPILSWMYETGRWQVQHLIRFVTYPFVHQGFVHAVMVLVFLLALGKMVGEVFGTIAVLLVFFLSAIVGALAYALLTDSAVPLLGGYPAVYGLIGSYTFMLWISLSGKGSGQYRAFTLIGLLLSLQLFFGLAFGGDKTWVADVFGFGTGFLLSFLLVPGAVGRIRDKLRQR